MTTPTIRAVLQRLIELDGSSIMEDAQWAIKHENAIADAIVALAAEEVVRALSRTPAALAAPEPEEMQGLVIDLTEVSLVLDTMKKPRLAAALTRAASLLKQQDIELATLRTVPVTISPGLAEKVYLDTEGRCWHFMPGFPGMAPEWRLIRPDELGPYDTHVAAASAIPLPTPQAGEGES